MFVHSGCVQADILGIGMQLFCQFSGSIQPKRRRHTGGLGNGVDDIHANFYLPTVIEVVSVLHKNSIVMMIGSCFTAGPDPTVYLYIKQLPTHHLKMAVDVFLQIHCTQPDKLVSKV